MRIKILRISIWVLFFIIALNLVYMQVIRGQYYYRLSAHNRIRVVPMEGKRGKILDRNGVVLADNRIAFDVMIIPQDIQEKEELFLFLSRVLKKDFKTLISRYHRKKYAPFAPVAVAQDITREQAFVLRESQFRYPSLLVQENHRRHYPLDSVGAHVLGYVGKISRSKIERLKKYGYTTQSMIGYTGVEEQYDQYLRGEDGGEQIEVNSRGQQVRLLGIKDARKGQDIQLTIDSRIQKMAEASLYGKPGAIVVIDVESGEVVGMISSPSFNPNVIVSNQSNDYFSDPDSPLLNRVIQALSPPGSVFKVAVAISALETKKITQDMSFHCPGYFKLGRRRIRCAHTHNDQSLLDAIAHSCNTYFINIGLLTESEPIAKYARLIGLGEKTKIDLPAEEKGGIPSKRQRRLKFKRGWYKGDTANLAIGQGEVLVTPIQLANMMATIARKGKLLQPRIIKQIHNKKARRHYSQKRININQKSIDLVVEGLKGAVNDNQGTARALAIPGLATFGKTGTAQTVPRKKHNAWFVGVTESDNGKYAYCVYLEHGGSSYYAVRVARDLLLKMKKAEIL